MTMNDFFPKIRKILLTVVLLSVYNFGFSQLQVANWYFGNKAGLNFNVPNGNLPTVLFDSSMATIEGCSTISDNNGNLLFYTDGIFVWNKNHIVMPGGNNLSGSPSSTQSGIIVPNPADNGLYYIFSIDANDQYYPGSNTALDGLEYTVIDMSLYGGLGGVSSSNNHLTLEASSPNLCSEKITAVKHFNQHDIWVITHLRNKFYSFLVTDSGVNTNPVVTTIAPNINPDGFVVNARGYMKTSPNGKYLAIAHYSNLPNALSNQLGSNPNNTISGNSQPGVLALYDFDNATGTVSNYRALDTQGTPYGVEFSPNSEFLYAELDYFTNAGTEQAQWSQGRLIQWKLENMSSVDIANINSSSPNLGSTWAPTTSTSNSGFTTRMRGALQLGIDGRLYYSKTRYYSDGIGVVGSYRGAFISIIQEPNVEGTACDLQINSYEILNPDGASPVGDTSGSNHYVAYGLPPFITSYFNNNVEIDVEEVCEGEEANFNLIIDESVENVTQIIWKMGDGTQYNNVQNVSHTYESAGTYLIEVELHIGSDGLIIPVSYELEVFPKPTVQNAKLVQCDGSTVDGKAPFILSLADDDIIVNSNGSSFSIANYESVSDAENEQNPLTEPYINTTNPQVIYARVENDYGCFRIAELELSVVDELFELTPWEVCDDASNDGIEEFNLNELEDQINQNSSGTQFAFYNSRADSEIDQNRIANPTNYSNQTNPEYVYIRVFNGDDCAALGRVQLVVQQKPEISSDFQDVEVCEGAPVILDPGAGFDEYLWNNGSTSPTLEVTESGFYSVTVTYNYNNVSCSSTKEVEVIIHQNPEVQNSELVQCEDNIIDGLAQFRLSDADAVIVQNSNGSTYQVQYFLSITDAQGDTNPLPNDYTNVSNPQMIYAKIENNNGCVAYAELELSVVYEEFEIEDPLYRCDDESNDGVAEFDLTQVSADLISEYEATDVVFYNSEEDAQLNQNAIISPDTFQNNTNPQTIYIRVLNGVNCAALGNLRLIVKKSPVLEIDDATICPGESYTFDAGPGFSSYLWNTGSTSQSITVNEEGVYSVTVTNEAECSTTEEAELFIDQPVILNIIVNGNSIEIIAQGQEPLEYSLDLENWRASNIFSGLPFGIFAAYVRDANGCISEGKLFSIITLPNIITPNGDGINDGWNVKGLDIYPGTVIEIYDRYGKLIHTNTIPDLYEGEIDIIDILNDKTPYIAWDGKYLGRAVPSTSYWYIVKIPDGRKLTGYLVVKNRNSDN